MALSFASRPYIGQHHNHEAGLSSFAQNIFWRYFRISIRITDEEKSVGSTSNHCRSLALCQPCYQATEIHL